MNQEKTEACLRLFDRGQAIRRQDFFQAMAFLSYHEYETRIFNMLSGDKYQIENSGERFEESFADELAVIEFYHQVKNNVHASMVEEFNI